MSYIDKIVSPSKRRRESSPGRRSIAQNRSKGPVGEPGQNDASASTKTQQSTAARFNAKTLKGISKALEEDPEIDFTTVMPTEYSLMLSTRKQETQRPARKSRVATQASQDSRIPKDVTKVRDLSSLGTLVALDLPNEEVAVVYPPSEALKDLAIMLCSPNTSQNSTFHADDLHKILAQSVIIWQSETNTSRFVARCNDAIAVKCVSAKKDRTEYTSLLYLERHAPELRVPRTHGLVVCGGFAFLFMSLVPGVTLDSIWSRIGAQGRSQIRGDLHAFFEKLRALLKPDDAPFGGVEHEGCKDTRRHTRVSPTPIYSSHNFYNFLYGKPKWGSHVYLELLTELSDHLETGEGPCVFTHGDVHAANILVNHDEEADTCTLSGIVDWEMSGFYPEWYESSKATNNLATNEESDWFLHMPSSISPSAWPARWLLDRLYDKHIV